MTFFSVELIGVLGQSHSVAQAGLEFEAVLPGIMGVSHYTWLSLVFIVPSSKVTFPWGLAEPRPPGL